MSEIKVENREIVTPGEVIAEGMDFLPGFGTYRKDDKIIASRLGIANTDKKVVRIISLSGRYLPKEGDMIIGRVSEILMSGWRVETNSAFEAVLGLKEGSQEYIERGADLTNYYNIGDYVLTKVINVTSQMLVDVSMNERGLRKLTGGRVININPNKVPRVIGKKGSMVSMVKNATGCRIIVGQNGKVWISGEPEMEILAEKTIKKIDEESHISGLTDQIKAFLEKETGNKIESNDNDNQGEENDIQ